MNIGHNFFPSEDSALIFAEMMYHYDKYMLIAIAMDILPFLDDFWLKNSFFNINLKHFLKLTFRSRFYIHFHRNMFHNDRYPLIGVTLILCPSLMIFGQKLVFIFKK